jgi:hypothetical protein
MNNIHVVGNDATLNFAAKEFARYARKVAGVALPIKHVSRFQPREGASGIWLGIALPTRSEKKGSLEASRWDDAYTIEQRSQQLVISGANSRSVLFGVYAYFERLGARWVRPGPNGEWLPTLKALPRKPFHLHEQASHRHRGVCIEGAPSLEHALGMLDWMAKRRMNSFFLQFQVSSTFWERWTSRRYNPYFGKPEPLSDADYAENDARVITEVKKRGLLLHQVGHGWTAASVGLPHNGWQTTEQEVAPEQRRWLAKVNGKRDIFQRIPVNTELCYSHAPAFKGLLSTIVAYARAHPDVDVLHIWLSDAMNNKCECKHCAAMSPADWYVKIVNELSRQLAEATPDLRFVFLSYFESWWAPEQLTVDVPAGNAILMFAPISRCFRHTLTDPSCADANSNDLQRQPLNHAAMPRTNQALVQLLGQWWKVYEGDSFLFDYYLWSGLHTQASDVTLARLMHKDMQALKGLGLNGHVSCQVLRSFWPTGLPMSAMADTLWNRRVNWRTLKGAFFQAAYGDDAEWVERYLNRLEKMLLIAPAHGGTERMETKAPKQLRTLEGYLQDHHVELLARADAAPDATRRESLQLLAHHNQFLLMKCQAVLGKLDAQQLKTWLLKSERQVHPFLDVPALMAMQMGA